MITRQIVFSGTPAYKAGDSVKAGDALIFPYVTSGEDNLPTGANGEVFGIIGYSATVSYGGSMTIKRASEQAEKVVPEDARVIRREINEVEAGGVYYVTATVYAEGRIDASR